MEHGGHGLLALQESFVPGNPLLLELLSFLVLEQLLQELDSLRLVAVLILAPAGAGARLIAPHSK